MLAELEDVLVNEQEVENPDFTVRVHVYLPYADMDHDVDRPQRKRILFSFTHEGLIIDVINSFGEVVCTSAQEYPDILLMGGVE